MKTYLLLSMILVTAVPAFAQESSDQMLVGQRVWKVPRLPVEGREIVYTGDVALDGNTKEDLFNRAYYWLKSNLKSGDIDQRIADKVSGHIAGRGKIIYNQGVVDNGAQGIYFDYDIRLAENGYEYRLSDFKGSIRGYTIDYSAMYREELNKGEATGQWTHQYRFEMLSDLHSFITLFLQGLKASMVKEVSVR